MIILSPSPHLPDRQPQLRSTNEWDKAYHHFLGDFGYGSMPKISIWSVDRFGFEHIRQPKPTSPPVAASRAQQEETGKRKILRGKRGPENSCPPFPEKTCISSVVDIYVRCFLWPIVANCGHCGHCGQLWPKLWPTVANCGQLWPKRAEGK